MFIVGARTCSRATGPSPRLPVRAQQLEPRAVRLRRHLGRCARSATTSSEDPDIRAASSVRRLWRARRRHWSRAMPQRRHPGRRASCSRLATSSAVRGGERMRLVGRCDRSRRRQVATAAQSHAQLRFSDEALLALKPESEFRIEQFAFADRTDGNERAVFRLVRGGFRTLTGAVGRVEPGHLQRAHHAGDDRHPRHALRTADLRAGRMPGSARVDLRARPVSTAACSTGAWRSRTRSARTNSVRANSSMLPTASRRAGSSRPRSSSPTIWSGARCLRARHPPSCSSRRCRSSRATSGCRCRHSPTSPTRTCGPIVARRPATRHPGR